MRFRWAIEPLAMLGMTGMLAFASGCGSKSSEPTVVVDPLVAAADALDAGSPKRALAMLGEGQAAQRDQQPKDGLGLALRLMALIELNEWGRVEGLVPKLTGADHLAVKCMFAAVRRDVMADKICRERGPEPDNATLSDGAVRAWARVAEDEMRLDEAELRLRGLLAKRSTIANRKAFVGYLERNGFVAEAVAEVEAWKKAAPEDGSLDNKLVTLLERKVRGDLLEKRAAEAEAAARRVLELDPKRAAMRYFLADALELRGDKSGAEAERAAAKAAGATEPPKPDTFPGMVAPGRQPPGQKQPGAHPHGHDHGHDHDHDHDH